MEVEAKASGKSSVAKVEEIETATTIEIMNIESVEEPKEMQLGSSRRWESRKK